VRDLFAFAELTSLAQLLDETPKRYLAVGSARNRTQLLRFSCLKIVQNLHGVVISFQNKNVRIA